MIKGPQSAREKSLSYCTFFLKSRIVQNLAYTLAEDGPSQRPFLFFLYWFIPLKLMIFFLNLLLAICKISKSERLVLKAESEEALHLGSVRRQLYRNIGVPVWNHETGFWVPSPEVSNRSNRLTQCCTQFKFPRVKILCVLYLHCNVAFTFKW